MFSSVSLSLLGFPLDIRAAMEKAFARDESCGFGDDVYSMSVRRLGTKYSPLNNSNKKNPPETPPVVFFSFFFFAPSGGKKNAQEKHAQFVSDFALCAQSALAALETLVTAGL